MERRRGPLNPVQGIDMLRLVSKVMAKNTYVRLRIPFSTSIRISFHPLADTPTEVSNPAPSLDGPCL